MVMKIEPPAVATIPPPDAPTPLTGVVILRGGQLLAARLVVAGAIILSLAFFITNLPASYAAFWRTATRVAYATTIPTPISPAIYAGLGLAFQVLVATGFVAMALLIVARRSDEVPALLASVTLVAFGVAVPGAAQAIASGVPVWDVPLGGLQALGWALLLIFAYVFPDGRFLPRWTRLLVPIWVLWVVGFFLFASEVARPRPYVIGISFAIWVAWFATGVLARAYRYFWLAGPAEQQQTKWVALGGLGAITGVLIAAVPSILALTFGHTAGNDLVYQLAAEAVISVSALLIPLTIGIAILRHRLFDIDLIINRALVYGPLTVLLGGTYFAAVVALQALARALTGQRSESAIAIVISTLLIAALFQPLRVRLQRAIDRGFYRQKYDATKALARFAATLRGEVDLAGVQEQLLAVVKETMQPAHVSLWLRKTHPEE